LFDFNLNILIPTSVENSEMFILVNLLCKIWGFYYVDVGRSEYRVQIAAWVHQKRISNAAKSLMFICDSASLTELVDISLSAQSPGDSLISCEASFLSNTSKSIRASYFGK
jgi:hypothetical protein